MSSNNSQGDSLTSNSHSSAERAPSRPRGSVSFDNRGRVVLVSGGSQGIGHAICAAFAASGAAVINMDIVAGEPLEKVLFVEGDTSHESDCERTIQTVVDTFGGLDVLVNNAAIQPPQSYVPLDALEREIWDRMLAVNLTGYTFLAKHAVKQMLRQTAGAIGSAAPDGPGRPGSSGSSGGLSGAFGLDAAEAGVIINLASGQAHRTARQVPCYGPIKAANVLQTMQWGIEYARYGIRVVSISPGAVDTPLVRASLESQGGAAALANRHPLGRIGQPGEIAAAALWLASPAASFVTATDLQVDGGLGAFGAFAEPYPT